MTNLFFTIFFYFSYSFASDAITNLGVSEIFERFCTCDLLSNISGKNVMIPHNTSSELSSFFSSLPSGVTRDSLWCGSNLIQGTDITYSMPNITSTSCDVISSKVIVTGITNNPNIGGSVGLTDTDFCTTCTCSYRINGGSWTTFAWKDSISFCQNDRLEYRFECPAGSNSTSLDIDGRNSFSISINPSSCP